MCLRLQVRGLKRVSKKVTVAISSTVTTTFVEIRIILEERSVKLQKVHLIYR